VALVTEDGTAKSNSESYVSVADADTYHSNRGNAAWAALTTTAKEIALRLATDYLTQSYRERWKGSRSTATQALDWPRQNVYIDDNGIVLVIENDEIPDGLKNACCEMALKSTSDSLIPDIERETASESIGSVSVAYFQGGKQNKTYRAVELTISPLLEISDGSMSIYRT